MGKLMAGIAVVLTAVAGTVAPATAQTADDDGMRARAHTTFVVDPAAKVIRVSSEMTLTNELSNPREYFYAYGVPVLTGSVDHRVVRADGQSLTVTLETADDPASGFAYAEIRLRPNLFPGQSLTFRLDYELPFLAPRTPGWSRGNDAVVTFPVYTTGDGGLSDVEVRVPDDYDVEVGGAELERAEVDGQVVLTATGIADTWGFMPVIVATKDDKLLRREAEVDGRAVTLLAWPDDAAWADYMAKQLDLTMPVLEELVGQPWPEDLDGLELVESSTPAAHGYAGWYNAADNSITLGDEFDPHTVAHELGHVWFNNQLFRERWITEGLADEFAQTTLEKLRLPAEPAVAPDQSSPAAVALNDWTENWSFTEVDHATEEYAYATAWYVMDQIAAEVGVEPLAAVVGAATEHHVAYPGDSDREKYPGVAHWQVLLDLLENEAGSTRAVGLFDRFVVTGEQRAQLQARTAARKAYAGLVERGGSWTPPFELRKAMGEWEFDEVDAAVADADEILALRADIETALEGLDVGPLGLEGSYETATNLENAVEEAQDTLDAARAYRDAQTHYDDTAGGLVARIGLLGSDTGAKLDDARSDLTDAKPGGSLQSAAAVERRLDTAVRNGLLRLAAAFALLVLLPLIRFWRRATRRRQQRRRDAEVAKLEAMYAAPEAREHPTKPPMAD